jgi:hypothetical protein
MQIFITRHVHPVLVSEPLFLLETVIEKSLGIGNQTWDGEVCRLTDYKI